MITRREFNRRMNAMNTRVLWLENALDSFLDNGEQVDDNTKKISSVNADLWKLRLQTEANCSNLWYKVNNAGIDFGLLLDYLGVEITTTPEKRAVVKKEKK